MLDLRDKGIYLRSSQNVKFKEEKLNLEILVKSRYGSPMETNTLRDPES